MHVSSALGMSALSLALVGCSNEETVNEINELKPRMEAEVAATAALLKQLPAAGSEAKLPCASAPRTAVVVTYETLQHRLGAGPEPAADQASLAAGLDRGKLGLMPPADLDRWRDEGDVALGSVINAGRALDSFRETELLVVLRTESFDRGKHSGKTIEKNGRWKGWAFVFDKKAKKLVGAASADAESPEQVLEMKQKGKRGDEALLLKRAATEAAKKLASELPCVKWP